VYRRHCGLATAVGRTEGSCYAGRWGRRAGAGSGFGRGFLARDLDAYLEVDSAMAARGAEPGESGDSLYDAVSRLEQSDRIVRVPGATVSVRNAADNAVLGESVTDSDGQCSVALKGSPPNVVFVVRPWGV